MQAERPVPSGEASGGQDAAGSVAAGEEFAADPPRGQDLGDARRRIGWFIDNYRMRDSHTVRVELMASLQFSFTRMLSGVALIAIALAVSARTTSETWGRVMLLFTVAVLLASLVGAILNARRRPFWTGFAVFGWGYLVFFIVGERVFHRDHLLAMFAEGLLMRAQIRGMITSGVYLDDWRLGCYSLTALLAAFGAGCAAAWIHRQPPVAAKQRRRLILLAAAMLRLRA
jgi:hypothetical protein